jgi:hypothetical protein
MDKPFTILNPGYWSNRRGWPLRSESGYLGSGVDAEFARVTAILDGTHNKGDVFLLDAADQVGRKRWGDRWRAPPFAPTDTEALDRFMRTIASVLALKWLDRSNSM